MIEPSIIPVLVENTEEKTFKFQPGQVSQWLTGQGLQHQILEPDLLGVELIGVEPSELQKIAEALKSNGFDYLQCQGGYDEGPGGRLVSFYHLIKLGTIADHYLTPNTLPPNSILKEVRLKVFLLRDGNLSVPSLYSIFRGSDWQERETFDMFGISYEGHPHPKRLLMPEDWKGYPLRKDYIQPDFYEMQVAY
uniref:NAD(P)H-quinone oxidoreductase subunit J, organellar chromatophore n=1 Tax=Paulinella chromatophora TaxID=39717 RepID=NDHJ_PAUCH|nr:NADH dehydrogenase subunit J [Paulinella chromatophora]B1X4R3.1 RecName: Full=NAD(P)H-quinone oxidoreductase subunit J, organellar chromatophore; AltName: Full=NAD(P)H dehydrogenase subunit J; AltName: Full=NADH-plastoquinone oxidoreductase subunit J [Paulinella chromatophora]ACB42932.1 NADH dehydrogenase subunit J [Paulinella chromatophora]